MFSNRGEATEVCKTFFLTTLRFKKRNDRILNTLSPRQKVNVFDYLINAEVVIKYRIKETS
jgi:hypothetical protein